MKSIYNNFGLILIFFIFSNGYAIEMTGVHNVEVVSVILVKKKKWTGKRLTACSALPPGS